MGVLLVYTLVSVCVPLDSEMYLIAKYNGNPCHVRCTAIGMIHYIDRAEIDLLRSE